MVFNKVGPILNFRLSYRGINTHTIAIIEHNGLNFNLNPYHPQPVTQISISLSCLLKCSKLCAKGFRIYSILVF